MLSRVGSCHCDFGRRRVNDGWEADGYDNGYDSHYEPKYGPHHESSWGGSSSSGSSGSSGSGKSGKSGGKSGKSGGSWSGSGKGGKSGNSSSKGGKSGRTSSNSSGGSASSHAKPNGHWSGGYVPLTTPSPSRANKATRATITTTTGQELMSSSLDNKGGASKKKGTNGSSAYYQFNYEGYTDYYAEDFSPYNYDDYDGGREGKNNLFCCLFAPWLNHGGSGGGSNGQLKNEDEEKVEVETSTAATTSGLEAGVAEPAKVQLQQEEEEAGQQHDQKSGGNQEAAAPDSPATMDAHHPNAAAPDSPSKAAGTTREPAKSSDTGGSHGHGHSSHSKTEDASTEDAAPDNNAADDEEGPPAPNLKGILKVKQALHITITQNNSNGSLNSKKDLNSRKSDSSPSKAGGQVRDRRHLFPTYEKAGDPDPNYPTTAIGIEGDPVPNTNNTTRRPKSLNFNGMARVLTIPSRKDIPLSQKAQVWWQKCDYDEFKKTGRIISKAMECGGSEIWLTSSNAWGNRAFNLEKDIAGKGGTGGSNGDSCAGNASITESNAMEPKHDSNSSSKKDGNNSASDSSETNSTSNGNKW